MTAASCEGEERRDYSRMNSSQLAASSYKSIEGLERIIMLYKISLKQKLRPGMNLALTINELG